MQQGIAAASTAYLHLFKASHGDPGRLRDRASAKLPAFLSAWGPMLRSVAIGRSGISIFE
jgi:hypothetical protein